jgi:hypothetical protein
LKKKRKEVEMTKKHITAKSKKNEKIQKDIREMTKRRWKNDIHAGTTNINVPRHVLLC